MQAIQNEMLATLMVSKPSDREKGDEYDEYERDVDHKRFCLK
jgi:hypothetical protein